MILGDLTAHHIGRIVTFRPGGPARAIASLRHFTISDPETKNGVLRRTSVMLTSTGAGAKDHQSEHIGDSADQVVIGNG
jgi:hypothetical protein